MMRLADLLLVGEWVEPGIVVTMVTLVRPLLVVRRDSSVLLLNLAGVNVVRKMLKVSIPTTINVMYFCYNCITSILLIKMC